MTNLGATTCGFQSHTLAHRKKLLAFGCITCEGALTWVTTWVALWLFETGATPPWRLTRGCTAMAMKPQSIVWRDICFSACQHMCNDWLTCPLCVQWRPGTHPWKRWPSLPCRSARVEFIRVVSDEQMMFAMALALSAWLLSGPSLRTMHLISSTPNRFASFIRDKRWIQFSSYNSHKAAVANCGRSRYGTSAACNQSRRMRRRHGETAAGPLKSMLHPWDLSLDG